MSDGKKNSFSIKDLEKLGDNAVKKAFRSFRELLIVMLYIVAIFFVVNDFSFRIASAEEFAADKLPWLLLYVLAHYFCRDYGIQKGREDEEFKGVEKCYRELCDKARGQRREIEAYCRELSAHYTEARITEALELLGVKMDENGQPMTEGLDRRTQRAVKRAMRKKPIRITYRMLVDRADKVHGGYRPLKPSFESYIRRRSWFTVGKIVLLSFFTFSLTATLGSDPVSNFIEGIPYLVTMLSVSVTAILGAFKSVITYDIDCLNDRIAILEGFWKE